jgi:hypothetical protein
VLSVTFTLGTGLVLRLATAEAATTCRATGQPGPATDPLTDLVRALRHFAAGIPDVSCRWPDEPGGHFLDLSRVDGHTCAIAVHSFADPGLRTPHPWLPQRGPMRFGVSHPFWPLVSAFTTALQKLRTEHRDDFGTRWPWPFPDIELSRLRTAQSLL